MSTRKPKEPTAPKPASSDADWTALPNLLAGCKRTKEYHALTERYNEGERSDALASDIQALVAAQ